MSDGRQYLQVKPDRLEMRRGTGIHAETLNKNT